jgi:hypothetical protein
MSLILALPLLALTASDPLAGEDHAPASPAVQAAAPLSYSWYGWQPLLLDTAAVTLSLSAINSQRSAQTLLIVSLFPWTLGGPAMHFLHGRPSTAALSFIMRLISPVLIGYGLFGIAADNSRLQALLLGGLTVIVTAVIDDLFVSWAPVHPARMKPATASLQWAPFAGEVRHAPVVGLTGAF